MKTSPKKPIEVFDLYYQEARAHLLEAAAAFDRFERYDPENTLSSNLRYQKLKEASAILSDNQPNRAERFQLALSDLTPFN